MIIYKTTNLINRKIYIGQTNGKKKSYIGGGRNLAKAIKKYGKQNFKFEVLKSGDFTQEETDKLEVYYIKLYNSRDRNIGYNIESGGNKNKTFITSAETKLKLSLLKKGKQPCNVIKVINIITNEIYDSITIAERENNMKYCTLARMLKGDRKNKTNLRIYEKTNSIHRKNYQS